MFHVAYVVESKIEMGDHVVISLARDRGCNFWRLLSGAEVHHSCGERLEWPLERDLAQLQRHAHTYLPCCRY